LTPPASLPSVRPEIDEPSAAPRIRLAGDRIALVVDQLDFDEVLLVGARRVLLLRLRRLLVCSGVVCGVELDAAAGSEGPCSDAKYDSPQRRLAVRRRRTRAELLEDVASGGQRAQGRGAPRRDSSDRRAAGGGSPAAPGVAKLADFMGGKICHAWDREEEGGAWECKLDAVIMADDASPSEKATTLSRGRQHFPSPAPPASFRLGCGTIPATPRDRRRARTAKCCWPATPDGTAFARSSAPDRQATPVPRKERAGDVTIFVRTTRPRRSPEEI